MGLLHAGAYSVADLRERVAARHDTVFEDDDYGDHRWNPDHPRIEDLLGKPLRDAAVLIAVIDRPEGASVILTERTETLRNHSGQVAFPGGRVDDTDATTEFTALREADEEIGLRPDLVEIIARMPDYRSGSGYRISPVIGVVQPGFTLDINPDEVDEVFETPLAFLMDPKNHIEARRVFGEHEWTYFEMPHGGHRIWGVTAGIIRSMFERYYL